MLHSDVGHQCCIFDAVSLVKLCQLEVGSRRAIEWLFESFTVLIPEYVLEEGQRNLSDDDDERTIFFNQLQPRTYKVDDVFEKFADDHISHLPSEKKKRIDDGERIALALALEISRFQRHYILLVTDDYKAKPILEKMCDIDQIGIVRNSYDLLFFLHSRHSDQLPIGKIEVALRQLTYLLRDKSMPVHQKKQKPDELYEYYLTAINRLSPILPDG